MSDAEIEVILNKYMPMVQGMVANQMSSHKADQKDLIQDVKKAIVENLRNNKYKGQGQLGAYIGKIARHKIYDFRKYKNVREGTISLDGTNPALKHEIELKASEERPDHAFEQKELADLLKELMQKLKAKHRDVLVLHYYRHLEIKEIAEKLGIPDKKVRNRLSYARELLHKRLKNDDRILEFLDLILLFFFNASGIGATGIASVILFEGSNMQNVLK